MGVKRRRAKEKPKNKWLSGVKSDTKTIGVWAVDDVAYHVLGCARYRRIMIPTTVYNFKPKELLKLLLRSFYKKNEQIFILVSCK